MSEKKNIDQRVAELERVGAEAFKKAIETQHAEYLAIRAKSLVAHEEMVRANQDDPGARGDEPMCSEHQTKEWRHTIDGPPGFCTAPKKALRSIWQEKRNIAAAAAQKLADAEQVALDALSLRMIGLRVTYWYPASVGVPGATQERIEPCAATIAAVLRSGKVNLILVRNASTQHERAFSETPQASRWGWMANGLV